MCHGCGPEKTKRHKKNFFFLNKWNITLLNSDFYCGLEFWMSHVVKKKRKIKKEDNATIDSFNDEGIFRWYKTGHLCQPWAWERVLEIYARIFTQQPPWFWSLDLESPPDVGGEAGWPLFRPHESHPCSWSGSPPRFSVSLISSSPTLHSSLFLPLLCLHFVPSSSIHSLHFFPTNTSSLVNPKHLNSTIFSIISCIYCTSLLFLSLKF